MVTDAIIGVLHSVLSTVLGWLPTFTLPTWMSDTGPLATVLGYAGSMGAWFPTTLAATVLVAVLAAYAVAFGVKIVRIVASFATLGGGSAA